MSTAVAGAVADTHATTCCIVGAGPAGTILSLLLARQGIAVTLLEAHKDFDRDFRGDTIHPSTLDLLAQLGLSDKLHALPHQEMRHMQYVSKGRAVQVFAFDQIGIPFPYIMILPQSQLLELVVDEARRYPGFQVRTNANVQRLVEEDGIVRGVHYQGADGQMHEVRAPLTVAADGRFSRLRKLAGFEPVRTAPPMDIVWLRVPRRPQDSVEQLSGSINIGGGHFAVVLERPGDEWQIGYAILKGSFAEVKQQGIEHLKRALVELLPVLADRFDGLHGFNDVQILAVESSRIPVWHKPGLLLIGDAAHVMSPVGGIGIQYAVQDAVAAANCLTAPLKQGSVTDADLARVQQTREPAVKFAQKVQGLLQERIVAQALKPDEEFRIPWFARLLLATPILRNLPAWFFAYGRYPTRLQE